MNTNVMETWIEECFKPRPNAFFNKKSLLILDSMSSHKDEGIKDILKKQHETTLAVIPGGMTKKLQPLDITVNRVFKTHVRQEWEDWMCEGLHSYTESGKMRRATFAEVCGWVIRSWAAVKTTTITNGFKKAGIISGEEEPEDEEAAPERSTDLDEEMLALFQSDSEDEDFEGFTDV